MAFKSYTIDFILAAHDKMSKIINSAVAQSMTKLEKFERQTGKVSRRFGRMGVEATAMGAGVAAALAMPTKTAIDFEEAVARLGAVSGIIDPTSEALKQLENTALDMGRTTQFSASEAASAMQFLAMAGFSAKQNIQALPAVLDLAAASSTDLATASDIASDVMSGFGLQAADMTRVVNALGKTATTSNTTVTMLGETMKFVAPIAKQAGVSIEDVASAAGLLANVGIKGSQAGTTLRAMLLRLSAPTGGAAKELQKLGIQTRDSEGNVRSMTTILGELTDVTKDMGSGARLASLKTIFGEEPAAGVAELISQGREGMDKQLEKFSGAATVEEIAKRMSQTTGGQLKQLMSAAESAAISFGKVLTPAIQTAAEALKGVANFLNTLIKDYPVTTKVIGIAAAAFAALALVGGTVSLAISGVASAAGIGASALGFLSTAATFAGGVFRTLTAILLANPIIAIITAIAVAAYLIYDNWDSLVSFFSNLWSNVKRIFSNFMSWLNTLPSKMYNAGVAMFTAIWNGIKYVAGLIWEWTTLFSQMLLSIFNPVNWLSAGVNIMTGIWEGIKSAASWLLEKAASIGSSIASALNPFNWFSEDGENLNAEQSPVVRQMETYREDGLRRANEMRQQQTVQGGIVRAQLIGQAMPQQTAMSPNVNSSLSVNNPINLTINGNTTPKQQEEFAAMLRKNRGLMIREIEKAQRSNDRKKY